MYQILPNISASSIKMLKKCPMAWFMAYVQGVREVESADVLRIGKVWHKLMELLRQTGNGDAGLDYLHDFYDGHGEWANEHTLLAYSFIGYQWRYQNDTIEPLETEQRFEIGYGESKIVGVIDMIFRSEAGQLLGNEYKTTGMDIDLNGDYWKNLNMGVQARMYVWARRILGKPIDGMYYDVFRKPGIRPKLLSAADTKKFLADFTYMDTLFDIQGEADDADAALFVDAERADIKWNKKGTAFQIRETRAMYGARILSLIYADPDKYFMRKEIPITEPEIQEFERELAAVYTQMESFMDAQNVYKNEDACDSPYRCPYQAICYSRRNQDVIDGETPSGYKRVRLTYGDTE